MLAKTRLRRLKASLMLNYLNRTILLVFAILFSCLTSGAVVFNLKNGDRISGEVVGKGIDALYVKTSFGTIKLPKDQVESVCEKAPEDIADEKSDEGDKAAEQKSSDSEEASDGGNGADAKETSEEGSEAVEKDASKAEDSATETLEEFDKDESWVEAYRDFVHSAVPENWDFVFRGGLDYKNTSSKTISYAFSFDGHTAWDDLNDFKFNAYYEYAAETPESGVKSSTVDKYGIGTNYKRYLEIENTWYLTNMLSYGVDTIKGIKDQVDEMVGMGRTFKFFDEKLVINLAIGPAGRYINAYDYDQHWAALVTMNQDLAWDFHEYARLEQNFYLGENVLNVHQYNAIFGIGLVFKLSDLINLSARYSYSYDAINSSEAQKSEQRIILGFEIPLK